MDIEYILMLLASGVMFVAAILMLVLSTRGNLRSSGSPRPHWSVAGIPGVTRERALHLIAEGKQIQAVKEIRADTGMSLQHAKEVGDALRDGRPVPAAATEADLAGRARALKSAGQLGEAVTFVADHTGMRRDEAERFVTALGAE